MAEEVALAEENNFDHHRYSDLVNELKLEQAQEAQQLEQLQPPAEKTIVDVIAAPEAVSEGRVLRLDKRAAWSSLEDEELNDVRHSFLQNSTLQLHTKVQILYSL